MQKIRFLCNLNNNIDLIIREHSGNDIFSRKLLYLKKFLNIFSEGVKKIKNKI
jgi:hypothetical protein